MKEYISVLDGSVLSGDLPKTVVRALTDKKLTISAAESCTGGMFAKMVTDIPGSAVVIMESYVTYANKAKTKILGVRKETLESFGAVSEQTVREMAQGLFKVSGADVCVVFSGIAGPGGGTKEKPVGLVYTAVCFRGEISVYKLQLSGERDDVRTKACLEIFNVINKMI